MARLPLILLPGLLNTSRLWADQVKTLGKDREVAVCRTDHIGSISGLAEAVLAMTVAPTRFALAGLSMGGYVALEVWRQAPERVAKLALVDTSARPDTQEQSIRRRRMMDQAKAEGIAPIVLQQIPGYLAPRHVNDKRLTGIVAEMAHEVGVNGFLTQQQAILRRPDSRPDLDSIRCPTVVVVGADDQLTPVALAEEIADGISDAELVSIPDAGHLSPLENPEAVTAGLEEWLRD